MVGATYVPKMWTKNINTIHDSIRKSNMRKDNKQRDIQESHFIGQ